MPEAEARSLEQELDRRAQDGDNDAIEFFRLHGATKTYLSRAYYPWIQAKCSYFTEHGEPHINAVIQAASHMLEAYLRPNSALGLSTLDIYLILTSILWHDVGNVTGREGHADKVTELSNEIRTLAFPNLVVSRMVSSIVKAHGGRNGLTIPRTDQAVATHHANYNVFPKALAAIVRLSDEVSENHNRVDPAMLPHIPAENRIFWEYANCIPYAAVDPSRERIVVEVALPEDRASQRYLCPEPVPGKDESGYITLIEYVLYRLEKMNNERIYCAREFGRYLACREVHVRFAIHDEAADVMSTSVVFGDGGVRKDDYPDVRVASAFFEEHPNWAPERLRQQ